MRGIYFDTETTGVKTDKDRIIEIAALDPFKERTFVSFVNPGIPIPEEASAISHITDEMVKDAPSFKKVAQEFFAFCGTDAVLIAHNLDSFDLPVLIAECKRHEIPLPPLKTIDTLKWARRYRSDLPRHNLQYLREVYGLPPNQAHRALEDVKMLHALFSRMIDDLSFETVLELLSHETRITHMPFGKHHGKPLSEIPKDYLRWLAESGALDKGENKLLKEALASLHSSSSHPPPKAL